MVSNRLSFSAIEESISDLGLNVPEVQGEFKESVNPEENLVDLKTSSGKVKKDWVDHKFKVCLHVFTSKNNINWVLTDITKKQIYFKKSGGMETKRGYLKNSQKVALKNYDDIVDAIKNIKATYVFCYVKAAYGTKKHIPTFKSVLRIIESLKKANIITPGYVINSTARNISKVRLKGGRRGRR